MTYTIEAIPTKFRGVWYRSVLEADWGRWFYLHRGEPTIILATYEPPFCRASGVAYQPDFHLLGCGAVLEIKPFIGNGAWEDDEIQKWRPWSSRRNQKLWVFGGPPPPTGKNFLIVYPGRNLLGPLRHMSTPTQSPRPSWDLTQQDWDAGMPR